MAPFTAQESIERGYLTRRGAERLKERALYWIPTLPWAPETIRREQRRVASLLHNLGFHQQARQIYKSIYKGGDTK